MHKMYTYNVFTNIVSKKYYELSSRCFVLVSKRNWTNFNKKLMFFLFKVKQRFLKMESDMM